MRAGGGVPAATPQRSSGGNQSTEGAAFQLLQRRPAADTIPTPYANGPQSRRCSARRSRGWKCFVPECFQPDEKTGRSELQWEYGSRFTELFSHGAAAWGNEP